jgi:hypothetical protein
MRAIEAKTFSGYGGLQQIELAKPQPAKDKVLGAWQEWLPVRPEHLALVPDAIGGSVGNATCQLARAQGAGKVISTAGSAVKAAKARELGFEDVVDLIANPSSRSSSGSIRGDRL